MGYLFLALSLLCGATKGFCGKKTSGFVREYKDAMFANFIRMLFCIAIGFALLLFGGGLSALRVSPMVAWICLLSGFANASFVVLWLISVKNGRFTDVPPVFTGTNLYTAARNTANKRASAAKITTAPRTDIFFFTK